MQYVMYVYVCNIHITYITLQLLKDFTYDGLRVICEYLHDEILEILWSFPLFKSAKVQRIRVE